MQLFKKIMLALLIVFVAIQLIQPARNNSGQALTTTDITKTVNVPNKVLGILQNSCYDCHSNDSRYPWYVNLQPVGWIMANHIKEGKENLNFSEFGTYSNRKQANKLRAIAMSLKDGSMPLSSYTRIHSNAKLSKQDDLLVMEWALKMNDSLLKKNE